MHHRANDFTESQDIWKYKHALLLAGWSFHRLSSLVNK